MSVPGFLFGGSTGVTPDKLKRDRAVAEAMLAGAQRTGAPRNVGEGLNAVGQALMYRVAKGRADKGGEVEAQKREGIWKDLQAGFGATGMLGVTAPQAASAGASGAPAPSSTASLPKGELATYIRDGLTSRGLPGHVADGFMANFQDESGLNPGINEHKPLVPGSRGGFGLFQSTGPRRRALEGVAASRGVPASDVDTQLDVLAAELGLPGTGLDDQPWFGSEGRAAQSIMGARDTAGAAQAIVNDFLRPAAEHRASRTARYANLATQHEGIQRDGPVRPIDTDMIARTMQGSGTQVASLDPSIGMSGLSAKDTAVGQALGLAPSSEPARLSPAAAALNGIASAPQVSQPEQPMPQAAPQPAQYAQASMPATGGPNPQMLMGILSDPWASEEQRSLAQFLMQQQMSQQQTAQERAYEAQQLQERRAYDDRVRQEEYTRADRQGFRPATSEEAAQYGAQAGQIGPDSRFYDSASNGTGNQESFFGNPIAIQNPDGTVGYGQIGNRGSFRPINLGEGQTFAPPTKTVDTGTETILMDQAGNVIARTPKENYQEAYDTSRGKVEGEAMGDRVTGIGQTEATAQQTLDTLDRLENHPGFSSAVGWQGALPRWMSAPAGSDAAGFMSILDQVQGQAFLQAFESLKGGGQITEIEGQKAMAAITRLSRAISEEEFRAAVQELRDIVNTGVERARRGVAAAPPTTAAPGGGTVGTPQNPVQLDTVTVPAGMDQALWEIMTPEEKSLWLN